MRIPNRKKTLVQNVKPNLEKIDEKTSQVSSTHKLFKMPLPESDFSKDIK